MGADRTPTTTSNTGERSDHDGARCPRCSAKLFRRHCKYVCPNHGVVVDCGDPFTF